MATDRDASGEREVDERRSALAQALATDDPLTPEMAHDGFKLLMRAWDTEALCRLLTRYLGQPLSDSESAWARMHLANVFAIMDRPSDAAAAHESYERWLPGRTPRLSFEWPYCPPAENSPGGAAGPDEISVMFLGQSVEFATAYGAIGRYEDYVSKAEAALSRLRPAKNRDNVELRFYAVRIFLCAAQVAGDRGRAERCISFMHALADEADEPVTTAELHAQTLMSEIQLARESDDSGLAVEKIQQAMSLLEQVDRDHSVGGAWVRGYRHSLALHLIQTNRHDLALPLLDAILSTGDHFGGGFGWLMHAAAVWRVNRDRPRTVRLLRDARANDGRDLVGEFRALRGFEDVRDDPEFLQAISHDGGHGK